MDCTVKIQNVLSWKIGHFEGPTVLQAFIIEALNIVPSLLIRTYIRTKLTREQNGKIQCTGVGPVSLYSFRLYLTL